MNTAQLKAAAAETTMVVLKNIRQERLDRHYTQGYLGSKLNITQHGYAKIELGHSAITLGQLMAIALIFDIPVLDLLSAENGD